MRNFRKYRLFFVFLIYGVFISLFMSPISDAQETGAGTGLLNDTGLAAVEPEVEYPVSLLKDRRSVLDRNALGEVRGETHDEKAIITGIPLANANLGLRLVGTAVIENSGKSVAVIEHLDTGRQRAYWEGSRIGQTLVKRILWNRVIIDTEKGEMLLSMGPGPVMENAWTPSHLIHLDKKEVTTALPNYMSLVHTVSIRTDFQTGTPGGILIYNIDPDGLFGKIGLKDGDVIKAINGEPLTVSLDTVEIYDRLKQGGKIILSIRRGEEDIQLHFHVS